LAASHLNMALRCFACNMVSTITNKTFSVAGSHHATQTYPNVCSVVAVGSGSVWHRHRGCSARLAMLHCGDTAKKQHLARASIDTVVTVSTVAAFQ
jgi:hypothetical protein